VASIRKLLPALVAAGLILGTIPAAQAVPPAGYVMRFAEEFDGWGVDFTHKWDTHWVAWNVRHLAGNNDQSIKAADWERLRGGKTVGELLRKSKKLPRKRNYLHQVGRGKLKMRAWPVPDDLRYEFWGFPFVAGMLAGPRAHAQTYGYWETRLRLKKIGKGQHFALWLLPTDNSWPPEVDMLEAVSGDGWLYTNTHVKDGVAPPINWFKPPRRPDAWMTVGFEWTPKEMIWTIDGKQVRRHTANIGAKPMYPLFSWEVGSNWPGWIDSSTPWPAEVVVDYLRVYEKEKKGEPMAVSPTLVSDDDEEED